MVEDGGWGRGEMEVVRAFADFKFMYRPYPPFPIPPNFSAHSQHSDVKGFILLWRKDNSGGRGFSCVCSSLTSKKETAVPPGEWPPR